MVTYEQNPELFMQQVKWAILINQLISTLIIAIVLGLVPAIIAKIKGRSFFAWWGLGALCPFIVIPVSFFIKDKSGKQCPKCREWVVKDATICRHCQSDLG